jgi:hypothetical protein
MADMWPDLVDQLRVNANKLRRQYHGKMSVLGDRLRTQMVSENLQRTSTAGIQLTLDISIDCFLYQETSVAGSYAGGSSADVSPSSFGRNSL